TLGAKSVRHTMPFVADRLFDFRIDVTRDRALEPLPSYIASLLDDAPEAHRAFQSDPPMKTKLSHNLNVRLELYPAFRNCRSKKGPIGFAQLSRAHRALAPPSHSIRPLRSPSGSNRRCACEGSDRALEIVDEGGIGQRLAERCAERAPIDLGQNLLRRMRLGRCARPTEERDGSRRGRERAPGEALCRARRRGLIDHDIVRPAEMLAKPGNLRGHRLPDGIRGRIPHRPRKRSKLQIRVKV